jgi:hypothetical protein
MLMMHPIPPFSLCIRSKNTSRSYPQKRCIFIQHVWVDFGQLDKLSSVNLASTRSATVHAHVAVHHRHVQRRLAAPAHCANHSRRRVASQARRGTAPR